VPEAASSIVIQQMTLGKDAAGGYAEGNVELVAHRTAKA